MMSTLFEILVLIILFAIVLFLIAVYALVKLTANSLRDTEKQEERERLRREVDARLQLQMARRRLEELEERASSETESEMALWLKKEFSRIPSTDGKIFETFCADLCNALGYDTERMGGPGDQGADLLLRSGSEKFVAVQCKNYVKPVTNKAVQEVFAGARYYGTSEAWVMASNSYTKGAKELAERLEVTLHDRSGSRG